MNSKPESGVGLEPLFRHIVVISTTLAFCTMLAVLGGTVIDPTNGLSFQWHWTVLLWVLAGLVSVPWVWNAVWKTTDDPVPANKSTLRKAIMLFCVVALCSFLYPLRKVLAHRGGPYITGFLVAAVALTSVG